MLLALVDSLRCPADHEESPLVLSADAWRAGRIVEGTLGCPICHARYAIRDGRVDFTGGHRQHEVRAPDESGGFDPVRLAAQLDLAEPGGIVLLTGRYATHVDALAALVDAVYVLVDSGGVAEAAVEVALNTRVPFANGTFRGAAVDTVRATPEFLVEITRSMKALGRVVAPASVEPVDGLQLLARDEREWVAEVASANPVIPLRRSARTC